MSGSFDWRVNTGVLGGAFNFTTACHRKLNSLWESRKRDRRVGSVLRTCIGRGLLMK